MAIYEYGGKTYELADGTSNDVALAKIKASIGGASTAPSVPTSLESQIPTEPGANLTPTAPPEQSFVDRVIRGPIETAASLVTGIPAGLVGQGAGIVASMFGGKFGTQAGVKQAEDTAGRVSQAFTYAPRTAAGQEQAGAVGEALGSLVAVPVPMLDAMGRFAGAAARNPQMAARSVTAPAQEALAARSANAAQVASTADYVAGPRIDAVKAARGLPYPITLDPAQSNPSALNSAATKVTGKSNVNAAVVTNNKNKWAQNAKEDMAVTQDRPLNAETFNAVMERDAAPFREIKKLKTLSPNEAVLKAIRDVEIPDLINSPEAGPLVQGLVNRALEKVNAGMSGSDALKQIASFRDDARAIAKARLTGAQLSVEQSAKATANKALANALEGLIDANVPVDNPALLTSLKEARVKIAQAHNYKAATNLDTGLLDPTLLPDDMTGLGGQMRQVAFNFPESSKVTPVDAGFAATASRSGISGTVGALAGLASGVPGGAVAGGIGGMALGNLASRINTSRMVSPKYQARNAMPLDRRIPYVEPSGPVSAPPQLLGSSGFIPDTPFRESGVNFRYGSNAEAPPQAPQPPPTLFPQLPAPSGEATRMGVLNEQNRQGQASRVAGRAQEAAQAAQEVATREAGQGQRRAYQAPEGLPSGRALPEQASVRSAADKVAAGMPFDMTLAEKVAWKLTKSNLEEAIPALKSLDAKTLATKLADRVWVQAEITKAQNKARGFAEIEARAATAKTASEAKVKRELMMDAVTQLQDTLQARPSTRGYEQGNITRQFQRTGTDIRNN
jgi:hypothetical protein